MPRFVSRIKTIGFDQSLYLRQFQIAMAKVNFEAAGEFLRAAITRVPVQTGMARATFIPLQRMLAQASVDVDLPIDPIKKASKSRNIPLGESLGSATFDHTSKGEFFFYFGNGVWHYLMNEYAEYGYGPYANPSDPSIQPPWESMVLGKSAYLDYIRSNAMKRVPPLRKFIHATQVG